MMLTMTFLRALVQAVSLMFGGVGIFFLWRSFSTPGLAAYTIVFLTAAALISHFTARQDA
jgi:hypothetical protein